MHGQQFRVYWCINIDAWRGVFPPIDYLSARHLCERRSGVSRTNVRENNSHQKKRERERAKKGESVEKNETLEMPERYKFYYGPRGVCNKHALFEHYSGISC